MAKEVKLTKGFVAIVDDEDFDRVSRLREVREEEGVQEMSETKVIGPVKVYNCEFCADKDATIAALRAEMIDLRGKQRIDQEQCDMATSEAGKMAVELSAAKKREARLLSIIEDYSAKLIRIEGGDVVAKKHEEIDDLRTSLEKAEGIIGNIREYAHDLGDNPDYYIKKALLEMLGEK